MKQREGGLRAWGSPSPQCSRLLIAFISPHGTRCDSYAVPEIWLEFSSNLFVVLVGFGQTSGMFYAFLPALIIFTLNISGCFSARISLHDKLFSSLVHFGSKANDASKTS